MWPVTEALERVQTVAGDMAQESEPWLTLQRPCVQFAVSRPWLTTVFSSLSRGLGAPSWPPRAQHTHSYAFIVAKHNLFLFFGVFCLFVCLVFVFVFPFSLFFFLVGTGSTPHPLEWSLGIFTL